MTNRNVAERATDTRQRLEADANVWVATASMAGVPHLVPLSLAWDGTSILVATPTDSATVRNAATSGRARATLDSADDVVIFDTKAEAADFVPQTVTPARATSTESAGTRETNPGRGCSSSRKPSGAVGASDLGDAFQYSDREAAVGELLVAGEVWIRGGQ